MKQNKVIVISGATATDKTTLAIALAQKYETQIINFDSLLFYQELNIGTAKPTIQEMAGVPHHLIGFQTIKSPINAAQFCQLALDKIHTLHTQGVVPVLVGGSAFYLRALLRGMYPNRPPSPEVLKKSCSLYQKAGIGPFRQILKEYDPTNFYQLHQNDHYRIRRAVEYYWSTGMSFSSAPKKLKSSYLQSNVHSWNLCHLYLHIEKDQHWKIIRTRSEKIVEAGLVEEVSDLLSRGFTGQERPLLSIGHKEAQQYLDQTISNRKQLIEKITTSTRQLAKAQKTFFAHIGPKQTFNPLEDASLMNQSICRFLQS